MSSPIRTFLGFGNCRRRLVAAVTRLLPVTRFLPAMRFLPATRFVPAKRHLPAQQSRRRRSPALFAALASVLALGLAGCDAIPESGPVREGLLRLDQVERGFQFNPPGPQAGADREDIVRGFVRAASSSANDYEVAREYLAPVYSEQWDPSQGVLVDEGTHQYEVSQDNIATLSLKVVASVDEVGTLTLAEPGRSAAVQFELVEVDGEWRIASAPTGIILDRSTFAAVWAPRALYFLSGDNRLVPEVRWFLSRGSTLSTQIVRDLIGGPSAGMSAALHTAFPEGSALSVESVPVIDGTAVIDLTPNVIDVDDTTMQLLKRQVSLSLPSTITDFEISVHGTVVETGAVSSADDSPPPELQFIAVMQEGKFGTVAGGELTPIEGLSERINELSDVRAVTLAPDSKAAVVVSGSGASWVSEHEIVTVDPRGDILVPSLDALGYVWSYHPSQPGAIEISRADGFDSAIAVPWLEGRQTAALRVSTGGNHLAALVADDSGSAVLVAGIVRDENGQPIGLTDEVSTQLWMQGAPIDLDWIGDTRFVTLTESGLLGSSARVTLGVVGNFSTDAGAVAGGVSVSGGSRSLLRVLDDQGRLLSPQGVTAWQQSLTDVELVAKVG